MQPTENCLMSNKDRFDQSRKESPKFENSLNSHLPVPDLDNRRNSTTFAQLLECTRQLSIKSNSSTDSSRINSRRPSIAEISDRGIITDNSDDCIVITKTLGTSTTYFFQKDPKAQNSQLRPSATERGIYNFTDCIKEPASNLSRNTPLRSTCTYPTRNISKPGNKAIHSYRRPSILERGVPTLNRSVSMGNLYKEVDGCIPPYVNELNNAITIRRKKLDEEEALRESLNLIHPRKESPSQRSRQPQFPESVALVPKRIMEDFRQGMDNNQVERIVNEKKTTTMSPTKQLVENINRHSITHGEITPPSVIDRPYVRSRNIDHSLNANRRNVTIHTPTNSSLKPKSFPLPNEYNSTANNERKDNHPP